MPLDPQSEDRLKAIYPDLRVRLYRVFEDMKTQWGMPMRVTQGIRTWKYQEELYAKGRTAPGPIVTNSRPGDSIHHYGLAIDSCFIGPDPFLDKNPKQGALWREYGRLAKAHGFFWGGDWAHIVDRPHIQSTYGMGLDEIKKLYQFGGLTAVWAACDKKRGVEVGEGWGGQGNVKIIGSAGKPGEAK